MQHIISEINGLSMELSENMDKLKELKKNLPPFDWMIRVAGKYNIDTDFINKGIERDAELLQEEVRLLNEIKVIKIEIRVLWKRMKSISGQI